LYIISEFIPNTYNEEEEAKFFISHLNFKTKGLVFNKKEYLTFRRVATFDKG